MEKTIVAIATPIAYGGISVLRISGKDSLNIISKIYTSYKGKDIFKLKGYTGCYGYIHSDKKKIDDVILFYFKKPYSYTGEDVVEISCHGGILVTKKILRLILENGGNMAEPGEFTKRSFLNKKMSLIESESVIDIINANNDMALKLSISNMEGNLYKKISKIKENLLNIVGHIEAFIDFPEEDLEDLDINKIKNDLSLNKNELNYLIENYDLVKIIKQGIDTAIIGKPNVGKSSIMNLFAGFEKSIVTDMEGTTRDIIDEQINIGDLILNISDTAGIRKTSNIIEKIGIDKAKNKIKTVALNLFVIDNSKELSIEDFDIMDILDIKRTLVIINKIDLDKKIDSDYIYNKFLYVVEISVKDSINIKKIIDKINLIFSTDKIENYSTIVSNERQRNCVIKSILAIENSIKDIDIGQTLDGICVIIEEAIESLLELTGENVNQSIVDKIFSNFCVGK